MVDMSKEPVVQSEADAYGADITGEDIDLSDNVSEKKGTSADRHAMWRMGKVQEMRVSYFLDPFATGFSMSYRNVLDYPWLM